MCDRPKRHTDSFIHSSTSTSTCTCSENFLMPQEALMVIFITSTPFLIFSSVFVSTVDLRTFKYRVLLTTFGQ